MFRGEEAAMIGRRTVLLGIAGLLSVSALLAMGILLFGRFGETEGRILATTALLAGYGLLALPAAVLLEQGRRAPLASAVAVLSGAGAVLALVSIWWSSGSPDALGKAVATVTVCAVAATQTAALSARRQQHDPKAVLRLFALSIVLAGVIAVMFALLIWTETDGGAGFRVLAALVVLDVLVVALQPILARARPVLPVHHLHIALATGETVVLDVAAPDLATAAARAIRQLEGEGRPVVTLAVENGRATAEMPGTLSAR
jgi:hypothetical protein